MTLGERLKKYRLDKDLSMDNLISEFSKLYGLRPTKSMISRWENNLSEPTNSYLSAYARFFNLDLNKLLDIPRMSDASVSVEEGYYTDPEVAELAEELRTNPELKVLFSTSRNLTKEQMQEAYDYIKYLKSKETNNDD